MEETGSRAPSVSLDAKVAFLRRAESYPEIPNTVEVRETHMSWVFLTDRFAYKLKKPVRYEFLDFSTLEARKHFCEEEVRLNGELANGVYIAAVPLVVDGPRRLRLEEAGTAVDWLVKSHRLPADRTLEHAAKSGTLASEAVETVARRLAQFYKDAPSIDVPAEAHRRGKANDLGDIRRELMQAEYGLPAASVQEPLDALSDLLGALGSVLDERIGDGRVIEGHGDLRPEHIYLTPTPVIIDRLEFNRALRVVDPVDELSYLAMECDLLDASWVGDAFFRVYVDVTKDDAPLALIDFYKGYRACLRAKIAARHVREPRDAGPRAWIDKAKSYLALARRYVG